MHQIHYVIMAYRSVVFKSTGLTPNMLMLGRETSLPLDLIYEVPEPLKPMAGFDSTRKHGKGT